MMRRNKRDEPESYIDYTVDDICHQFRILVIGKANAGKTTILHSQLVSNYQKWTFGAYLTWVYLGNKHSPQHVSNYHDLVDLKAYLNSPLAAGSESLGRFSHMDYFSSPRSDSVLAVGGECLAHFAHELFLITTIRLLYLP
jgi:hypothetical protein